MAHPCSVVHYRMYQAGSDHFLMGARDNWAESAPENTIQPLALGIPRDTTHNPSPRGYPRPPLAPIPHPWPPSKGLPKPPTPKTLTRAPPRPPPQPSYPKSPGARALTSKDIDPLSLLPLTLPLVGDFFNL